MFVNRFLQRPNLRDTTNFHTIDPYAFDSVGSIRRRDAPRVSLLPSARCARPGSHLSAGATPFVDATPVSIDYSTNFVSWLPRSRAERSDDDGNPVDVSHKLRQ
jgi:hypothetical protein